MNFNVCDYARIYEDRIMRRIDFITYFVIVVVCLLTVRRGHVGEAVIFSLILAVLFRFETHFLRRFCEFHMFDQSIEVNDNFLISRSYRRETSIPIKRIKRIQISASPRVKQLSKDDYKIHQVTVYFSPKYLPFIRAHIAVKVGSYYDCEHLAEVLSAKFKVPLRKSRHPGLYFFTRAS